MAEGKRQRDETLIVVEELEEPKRRKSYNQILSFLDEEDQDDSNQDVSSIFTTLQRELSFDSVSFEDPTIEPDNKVTTTESTERPGSLHNGAGTVKDEQEEEQEDRLMKRLLEATDDELGIPNYGPVVNGGNEEDGFVMDGGCGGGGGGGDDELGLLSSCGGLWELEDEAANYYTWFQSELFM